MPAVDHADFLRLVEILGRMDDEIEGPREFCDAEGIDLDSLINALQGRLNVGILSVVQSYGPEVLDEHLDSLLFAAMTDGFTLGYLFGRSR